MLTVEQLCEEIECLEGKHPTWDLCNKLASLYVIKDHMMKEMENEKKAGTRSVSVESGPSAMTTPSMSMSK